MKIKLLILILTLTILIPLILFYIDSYSLAEKKYTGDNFVDTLNVHFIHASLAYKSCKNHRSQDFPYSWGHVVLELDSLIYGFEYADKDNIHFLPNDNHQHFNALFTKEDASAWLIRHQASYMTRIQIPIQSEDKIKMLALLNRYSEHIPYDYAFWGMRCASSTYEILAKADIIPAASRWQCIRHAFYPGQLKASLTRWALNNGLIVEKQQGATCRLWE